MNTTTPEHKIGLLPTNDKFLFGVLSIIALACFAIGTHHGVTDILESRSLQIQTSHWGGMYILGGLMWHLQYQVLDPKPFQKNMMKKVWILQNCFIALMTLGFIIYMIVA